MFSKYQSVQEKNHKLLIEEGNRYDPKLLTTPNEEYPDVCLALYTLFDDSAFDFYCDPLRIINKEMNLGLIFPRPHFTLFTFVKFAKMNEEIRDPILYGEKLSQLEYFKNYKTPYLPPLEYSGLILAQSGIIVQGYSKGNEDSYNILRNHIRDNWEKDENTPIYEPYINDVYHSTICRFTRKLTTKELEVLEYTISKLNNRIILDIQELCVGICTWKMNEKLDILDNPNFISKFIPDKKFIAHRGNINGPSEYENKPEYILSSLSKNPFIYVEIDIWVVTTTDTTIGITVYTGHDYPQYKVDLSFLLDIQKRTYFHAKNHAALLYLLKNIKESAGIFSHDIDPVVLTSNNELWCYPGCETTGGICVMPEMIKDDEFRKKCIDESIGICSDYIDNKD